MGSRFYGSVSGSAASDATRQGTARSGISGHIRGWESGVQVDGHAEGDEDVFNVYVTRGSGSAGGEFALSVKIVDGRVRVVAVGDIVLDALEEE